jgi:hypothetical protein
MFYTKTAFMKPLYNLIAAIIVCLFICSVADAQPKKKKKSKPVPVTTAAITLKCPGKLPGIRFTGRSTVLSVASKETLSAIADAVKQNPTATLLLTNWSQNSKSLQATCFKRVSTVKYYLIETLGISSDRVTVNCVIEQPVGDSDVVYVDCQ